MTMYVLIERKSEGQITASLVGWPEITAQGSTEADAVLALRRSFAAHLGEAKVIPLELEGAHPWLQTAGMFKDDPFANEFDAVMAAYRRECDHEDISPTTQDHAA
ncbi:MAG: type II toxin-antitoxin system HicB family antitoxin [Candidatus Viridilinea halotolerans]|uniref:Type II toxin-antitoxin system HicB family antitoxin n=1 Tax=Candidatus Viridilinea halotolerans TaxID=2491704 RepID=A0A426U044_9CHLR|nr:MAG: type II toxin-antitoxin system HicB family antitoxin [Candidatus Viridilinea halotolerans]